MKTGAMRTSSSGGRTARLAAGHPEGRFLCDIFNAVLYTPPAWSLGAKNALGLGGTEKATSGLPLSQRMSSQVAANER
jgi:hypothetical protein